MTELKPASECLMALYREKQTEFTESADTRSVPVFNWATRQELGKAIGRENVPLVEAIARFGDYGDSKEMLRARVDLAKEMKKHGHLSRGGKRPGVGLKEMVEDLTPVLLYFGLPLATGDMSDLVVALQYIGEDMGVPGDPRNELRRLREIAKKMMVHQRRAMRDAVERAATSWTASNSCNPPRVTEATTPPTETLAQVWPQLAVGLRLRIRQAVAKGLAAMRISPPP